jgi:hypothetical protein
LDFLGVRFVHQGYVTELSFPLGGLAGGKMPGAGLSSLDLPFPGKSESFGGALIGLYFWHNG